MHSEGTKKFGATGPEAFTCTEEWPAVAIEDLFGVDLADPVDLRVGSRLGTAEVLQTWIRFCRFGAVVLNFCVYMHTRGDFSPLPFARLWTAPKCTKRSRKKRDQAFKGRVDGNTCCALAPSLSQRAWCSEQITPQLGPPLLRNVGFRPGAAALPAVSPREAAESHQRF